MFTQLILSGVGALLTGGCYYSGGSLPGPFGIPTPPAADPNPRARAEDPAKVRAAYRHDHDSLTSLPLLVELPHRERFSPGYLTKRLRKTGTLLPDVELWKVKELLDPVSGLSKYEDFFARFSKKAVCQPIVTLRAASAAMK